MFRKSPGQFLDEPLHIIGGVATVVFIENEQKWLVTQFTEIRNKGVEDEIEVANQIILRHLGEHIQMPTKSRVLYSQVMNDTVKK